MRYLLSSFVLFNLNHRGIQHGLAAQHVHTSVVCAQGQFCFIKFGSQRHSTWAGCSACTHICCMCAGPVNNRDCCMCTGPVTNTVVCAQGQLPTGTVVCAQGQLTTGTVVCAQGQLPTLLYVHRASYQQGLLYVHRASYQQGLLYVHRASYQRDCCMRTGPVTNRDCCMCTGPVTNRDTQALVACCCFNKGNITGSMTLPSNVVEIGSSAPIQVSLGVVCDKLKPIYRQQLRREPVVNVGGGDVQ